CRGKSSHLREYSRFDGVSALSVPEIYKTDTVASFWGCPKTKLRRKDEKRDIPMVKCKALSSELYLVYCQVSDEILGTQSREFRRTSGLRVVPVRLPEHSPDSLKEISTTMFLWPFGMLCASLVAFGVIIGLSSGLFFLQVCFVLLSFILFTFPFPLHHMSFGSQTVGDAVVLKFDMHVYTSVLTFDEVKNIVAEYAIPLDLHPCIPPSGLTMNRLLADKIDPKIMIMIMISFYKLNKQGHWFSFERRSGNRSQGKIFNEFCTSLKHWKDRFFLTDRHAISDAMPWRHQDSSVTDPAPTGVRAEDIRDYVKRNRPSFRSSDHVVCDWSYDHIEACGAPSVATSMSQFLKFPMAGGVRVGKGTTLTANEVIHQHTTSPLPFGSQVPEKSHHQKVVEYENERVLAAKRKAQATKDRAVGKRAATKGASQRTKKKKTTPLSFALSDSEADESNRSGSGTHHSTSPLNTIIPNEAELIAGGDGLILEFVNRVEENTNHHLNNVEDTTEVNSPLSEHSSRSQHSNPSDDDTHNVRNKPAHTHASGSTGHGVSSSSGGSHRRAFSGCNPGGDGIGSFLYLLNYSIFCTFIADLGLTYAFLRCRKEAGLNEKLAAVEKEMDDLLDRDREREYDEYKKSLSDVFNLAIAAGWSEGVKAVCSEEEAEAFLATVVDYDLACETTFMSEFDSLFNKSYPYVEKMTESSDFLWEIYRICGRKVMCVTWPLALGLIRNVLHSR
nr:hypothetical protein [Tanacetum cinerariifolium]